MQDTTIGVPAKVGKLIKQKDIAEDRKCLMKQSENISDENLSEELPMDSPKFLIPPEKFDSTPRSRSQSVELPDFILLNDPARKLSLNPATAIPPILEQTVNPVATPMTIVTKSSQESLPDYDEGLVALMRSRSGQHGVKEVKSPPMLETSEAASWARIKLGSPPAKRSSETPSLPYSLRHLPHLSKKGSLDLPFGPAITITPMSEVESDADTSSGSLNPVTSSGSTSGMNYLSPFTIITTCSSRATSESNLSSSGYSSMASPGPSRSGSSNPLCISESEDTSTPTKSNAFFPKLMSPLSSVSGLHHQPGKI